jgi:hypothetical protein
MSISSHLPASEFNHPSRQKDAGFPCFAMPSYALIAFLLVRLDHIASIIKSAIRADHRLAASPR